MTPEDRISELEEDLRAMSEAARMAAETVVTAIDRIQAMEIVVQAASRWRHAHDSPDPGAITRVVRAARELRDLIDAYERTRSAS